MLGFSGRRTGRISVAGALCAGLAAALLSAGCASDAKQPGATDDWKPATPNAAPPYPAESRVNGEQGQVLLHVLTGPDGRPTRVEVKKSSGYVRLDDAAVAAVRKWQFKPLKDDGTITWREVPINFMLSASGAVFPR
ncbi:energy transducer TonB [Variovorax sp. J22R133]|uniref:energy transducer TonB n=1 Tax=Variovorax brevis TaxID=3053503 RepID=UPI002574A687|nr:energy transducer TonB [Variovorax sp. J22R133]MDM0115311.1 energy transducer TonB [Variovorax sp. J22R133]